MASAAVITPAHREVFLRAGRSLTPADRCGAVLLADTRLTVVSGPGAEPRFTIPECAQADTAAIASVAMTDLVAAG